MSVNSEFKVIFSLNEVKKNVESIYDKVDDQQAFNGFVDGIMPYYTSHAPYTVVSDIAANVYKFNGECFSDKPLAKQVNLGPNHIIDRVTKSLFLSEGRAAFGLGFFTDNELVTSPNHPDYEQHDMEYSGLKTLNRQGYEMLARYLAFRYSQGLISLSTINSLADYVKTTAKTVDPSFLVMVIITGLNNKKETQFLEIIRKLNRGMTKARDHVKVSSKLEFTNQELFNGVLNMILIGEAHVVYMASDNSETDKRSKELNTLIFQYFEHLFHVGSESQIKGMYQFCGERFSFKRFEEITQDISNILELEK